MLKYVDLVPFTCKIYNTIWHKRNIIIYNIGTFTLQFKLFIPVYVVFFLLSAKALPLAFTP